MSFPNHKYARLLTIVLMLQAGVYYALASRSELTPAIGPLSAFPTNLGDWHMTAEFPMDPDIQRLLNADDTLSRGYSNPSGTAAPTLFIAFFKTQRYGQSPHSPKNCLPGAGWDQVESGTLSIDVPNWHGPIVANKYLVSHGDQKVLTIYWYQSHNRVIASEFSARFWLVMDAVRYRRSDTSIVRVMVPVKDDDVTTATHTGTAFVQTLFPTLLKHLPA